MPDPRRYLALFFLRQPRLRRFLTALLKQHYFRDLNLRIPIGRGIFCPIHSRGNFDSFSEIFCRHEYAGLWEHLAPPQRWLDLGAHAGYFTLYVAAQHSAADSRSAWRAALVEPDPRMRDVIADGVESNGLAAQTRMLWGMLGSSDRRPRFALRESMLSSAVDPWGGKLIDVALIDEAALMAAFPPPYDLVKVDIEGSEYDFVRGYPRICAGAKAMVIEWHAPTADDPLYQEMIRTLQSYGLTHRITLRPSGRCLDRGFRSFSGLDLFLRAGKS
jgi:FkbM family methyltransferase